MSLSISFHLFFPWYASVCVNLSLFGANSFSIIHRDSTDLLHLASLLLGDVWTGWLTLVLLYICIVFRYSRVLWWLIIKHWLTHTVTRFSFGGQRLLEKHFKDVNIYVFYLPLFDRILKQQTGNEGLERGRMIFSKEFWFRDIEVT